MRALTRPNPEHNYNATTEINRLRTYRDAPHADPEDSRNIPAVGQAGKLLLAHLCQVQPALDDSDRYFLLAIASCSESSVESTSRVNDSSADDRFQYTGIANGFRRNGRQVPVQQHEIRKHAGLEHAFAVFFE